MTVKSIAAGPEAMKNHGPVGRAPNKPGKIRHFIAKSAADLVSGRGSLVSLPLKPDGDGPHLEAAADWLMRSIAVCGGRASSKGYRFMRGWMPAYPETSGYIIPTLLTLGNELDDPDYAETAWRIGGWLTGIQLENGGYSGRELGVQDAPDVFDTGMILLGFNALLIAREDDRITEAAARAAGFLASSLDENGCFARNTSHGMIHAYNVRAAWALLAYGAMVSDEDLQDAALSNVDWTLRQQTDNGFFLQNAFKPGGNANTHGIAYVLRGLLQCHDLTGRQDLLQAVVKTAEALLRLHASNGWIAAELGPDWAFRSSHICLTGYAQLGIVFHRLSLLTGDGAFAAAADKLIGAVARSQDITSRGAAHYGAIAGSYPFYGAYAPLQYPNWATKFFIDALLLRRRILAGRMERYDYELYAG